MIRYLMESWTSDDSFPNTTGSFVTRSLFMMSLWRIIVPTRCVSSIKRVVERNMMLYTSTLVLAWMLPFWCCSCFSLEVWSLNFTLLQRHFYFRCGFSDLWFFKVLVCDSSWEECDVHVKGYAREVDLGKALNGCDLVIIVSYTSFIKWL